MKVTPIVEKALAENQQCRNSDKVLMIKVWHDLGFRLTAEQRVVFMDLPSVETIHRVRRKLQESGRYLAAPSVRTERLHKSLVVQQNAPSAKPARLEQLVQERLV